MNLTVTRDRDDGTQTFGTLTRDDTGARLGVYLELPDKGNAPRISCVPAGVYVCKIVWTADHHFLVPELQDVPGRDACEIHPANWVRQLLGCGAPGESIDTIEGAIGVTSSRDTFAAVMALLGVPDVFAITQDQATPYLGITFQLTIHAVPTAA